MAARVGTALSDENILKECAHYRPIPMHLTNVIVDGNMKPQTNTPFSSKPLKYHKQVARPEHFDAFAKSLARNLGNDPEFRSRLQSAYAAVMAEHAAPPDPAGPDPAPAAPPAAPPPPQGPALPGLDEEIQRLIQEMQGPAVQPVPEQYNNPIQQELPENVNLDAIPEEAEASDGDSVPELEPDFVDEVGNVDPNDPRPFGEPSESSEEEGPSPSTAPPPRRTSRPGASRPEGFYSEANQAARGEGNTAQTPASEAGPSSASSSTDPPPPRRSSRAGANRPAGFYSEANQAARGSGAGTTAPNDPSHSNFFFQR